MTTHFAAGLPSLPPLPGGHTLACKPPKATAWIDAILAVIATVLHPESSPSLVLLLVQQHTSAGHRGQRSSHVRRHLDDHIARCRHATATAADDVSARLWACRGWTPWMLRGQDLVRVRSGACPGFQQQKELREKVEREANGGLVLPRSTNNVLDGSTWGRNRLPGWLSSMGAALAQL